MTVKSIIFKLCLLPISVIGTAFLTYDTGNDLWHHLILYAGGVATALLLSGVCKK